MYPNKILREKCEEVKEFDEALDKVVLEMLNVMYKKNGVGLAAPQIGVKKRIITIFAGETPIILVNPKIIKKEGEEIMEEGCLSFPGLFFEVKRAKKLKVEAQNIRGGKIALEPEGLLAQAIQHEIDHLDGILFIDKLSFWKKWRLRKKLKEIANKKFKLK